MTKILMYHSVGGGDGNGEAGAGLYCVTAERLKEQLQYVSELARYRVRQLNGQTGKRANGQTLILTFDDGLLDNYTNAYPILKDLGLSAYFFILVGRVGAEGYMNWEQIKELRDSGMTIGSHGMTHRILTTLKDADVEYELTASKRFLEDNLGHSVDELSIPRGFYDKRVIDIAKRAGYKTTFTSESRDTNGFILGRIAVKRSWDLEYFKKVLNNGFSLKDKTEDLLKNSSKKILGAKNYDMIRSAVIKTGALK